MLVDDDPSAFFLARQLGNQRIWRRRHGAHQCLSRNPRPAFQQGRFPCGSSQPRIQAYFNSPALEQLLRELGETFLEFGQNQWTGVQQDHVDLGWIDTPEAARTLADEIVHLGHRRRIGAIVSRIPMLPEMTSGSMGWKTK